MDVVTLKKRHGGYDVELDSMNIGVLCIYGFDRHGNEMYIMVSDYTDIAAHVNTGLHSNMTVALMQKLIENRIAMLRYMAKIMKCDQMLEVPE